MRSDRDLREIIDPQSLAQPTEIPYPEPPGKFHPDPRLDHHSETDPRPKEP
jgi:hypothetical protein